MPNFLPNLIKEQNEAYEACNSLRMKAPYLNLRCEKLIESSEKNGEIANMKGIKLLSSNEANTRKVNKSEEIKLRNLIKKLTNIFIANIRDFIYIFNFIDFACFSQGS